MKKQRKKKLIAVVIVALVSLLIFGYIKFFNGTFIYISTGFGKDGLLKTGNKKASVMEADILLADAKSEYEDLFGTDIWNQSVGDVKFDEYVKEQVKAKLERVYCMNVLADKKGVVLSRNQKTAVSDAAEEYYNSLSDEKRNEFNITKEKLVNMFTSFAIADTLYNDLTDNLDIEVSYDEARVITVQYICADTLEDIKKAAEKLYGGYDKLSEESRSFIETVYQNPDLTQLYAKVREDEKTNKDILIEFEDNYPDVLNGDNLTDILKAARAKKKG